jgi:hypothetical protein
LTSALDGSEWPVSRHGGFIPVERASDAHAIGGWLAHKAGVGLWTGIMQYFLNATNLFREEQVVSLSILEMGALKTERTLRISLYQEYFSYCCYSWYHRRRHNHE